MLGIVFVISCSSNSQYPDCIETLNKQIKKNLKLMDFLYKLMLKIDCKELKSIELEIQNHTKQMNGILQEISSTPYGRIKPKL